MKEYTLARNLMSAKLAETFLEMQEHYGNIKESILERSLTNVNSVLRILGEQNICENMKESTLESQKDQVHKAKCTTDVNRATRVLKVAMMKTQQHLIRPRLNQAMLKDTSVGFVKMR